MLVGYARVSTADQDPAYQLRALQERGCEKVFTDRCTGRRAERPELAAALEFLRPGDTLAVWKFDRLARDLRHLIELGLELDRRGCQLASLTEAIDTATPGGRLVFSVFGAMAQFEADLNSERTREAYRIKRAAGVRWGRRSPFHDPENVRMAQALLRDPALTVTAVAKRFGTSRNVIYAWFPGGDPDAYNGTCNRRNGK
ncbi:MAG: recombinase family protein [Bryobacterales bacterium]|nr:recombinase family protein [Bryobacterales bacterium]